MLVIAQKEFVAHCAVRSNQIVPGPWHPVHHFVIFRYVGIEDSIRANDLTTRIRQKRICDLVGFAEIVQNLVRVVCNRRGVYSLRLELIQRELQLDELIAAVGSPIGAATENK